MVQYGHYIYYLSLCEDPVSVAWISYSTQNPSMLYQTADEIKSKNHTWLSWLKMEGISLTYSLYPMYERFYFFIQGNILYPFEKEKNISHLLESHMECVTAYCHVANPFAHKGQAFLSKCKLSDFNIYRNYDQVYTCVLQCPTIRQNIWSCPMGYRCLPTGYHELNALSLPRILQICTALWWHHDLGNAFRMSWHVRKVFEHRV